MKTVCPNCYQKFDVPDEYFQQEILCEKCHRPFYVNKAKFCTACGKANPIYVFQCHACQHPFQLTTDVSQDEVSSSSLPESPVDRSGVKLNILMQIVTFLFSLGSLLNILIGFTMLINGLIMLLCGLGMLPSSFQEGGSPAMGLFGIIFGVSSIAIYGRLIAILSVLTQPAKKAVQTTYAQLALMGSFLLSFIGLGISFFYFTGTIGIAYTLINVVVLLFLYKIFQLWQERCCIDEDYEEPKRRKK